jgi:hypothetical protein
MDKDEKIRKCKVHFVLEKGTLDDSTPWPPYEGETIWAELINGMSARLENSPFYAKGISYLDEVRLVPYQPLASDEDLEGPGYYEYEAVLRHSGHGTVRTLLRDDQKTGIAERALDEVLALGCTYEGYEYGVSIDIPPDVDSDKILSILEAAKVEGAIFVDVGFLPKARAL